MEQHMKVVRSQEEINEVYEYSMRAHFRDGSEYCAGVLDFIDWVTGLSDEAPMHYGD